jgi:hypothetical protein
LYIGWKILKRTKVWKPAEMDFVTVRAFFFFEGGEEEETASKFLYSACLILFFSIIGYPYVGRDRERRSAPSYYWRKDCGYCILI